MVWCCDKPKFDSFCRLSKLRGSASKNQCFILVQIADNQVFLTSITQDYLQTTTYTDYCVIYLPKKDN